MAFPTSPTNGQIHNNMKYNSSLNLWKKSDDIIVDQLNITDNPQFLGTGSTNCATSSVQTILKTKTTRINLGSHYNESTGEFTCPLTGNYFCYFDTLISTPSAISFSECEFRKNGTRFSGNCHSMHDILRNYEPVSLSCIIYATAGDKLSLFFAGYEGGKVYNDTNYTRLGFVFIN